MLEKALVPKAISVVGLESSLNLVQVGGASSGTPARGGFHAIIQNCVFTSRFCTVFFLFYFI